MDNLNDLISAFDFLLLFVYIILAYYLLRLFIFKKADKKFKRLIAVFLLFKVFCAVVMSLLTVYYWGVADNIAYFGETRNFINILKDDLSNVKYFFLPVESYNDKIQFDNKLIASVNSIGVESNFFVIKVSTLFYPLAFGSFLLVNFLFALLATVGQLKFYIALSNRYPHIKRNIAVAVLFIPSVLLYSSQFNKETTCIAFMGFAIYSFWQILNNQKKVLHFLLLMISITFVAIVKAYVVVTFFAAVLCSYFTHWASGQWKKSILHKVSITAFLAVFAWLIITFSSFFDSYMVEFASKSNTFQEQYNADAESSAFELGEVETSFSGLIRKAPMGIYTTYFRPQVWEAKKPIVILNALESSFVFLLALVTIISRRRNFFPLMRNDRFANVSVWFVLFFGVVVGLTTFNFGTLVRYKTPAVPFLVIFIFLLLHYRHPKNKLSH